MPLSPSCFATLNLQGYAAPLYDHGADHPVCAPSAASSVFLKCLGTSLLIPRPFVLLHLFKTLSLFLKVIRFSRLVHHFRFFIPHSFQLFPTTTIMHFSATQAFAFAHFMAAALAAPAIPILDLLVAAEILQAAAIQEFSAGAGLSPICPSLNTSDHGCIRCRTHLFTAIRIYANT
jgi:hypothetical protein